MHACVLSYFSYIQLFTTSWTVAHQALLSMGFSRQEYWSGFLWPPPGALPDPGIEPASLVSPALVEGFFTTSITWEAKINFQFSHSAMSDSLQPHGPQHARLPCPLPTPGTSSDFIKSVMPSTHLILCCPFLLLSSVFPTIRLFFNESALRIIWPKYWSFSFNISHSNEYSGMISFKMNWLESPCRHSKIFSNTKSINSSALSSLYGPTLTCILDY